ncbi:MAG TPA: FAD-binding oxidoreductase [Dehalococcoidia bacterium]|nr:FAD-binding oxidoreductase [Dehalococcoidia bacterium]
MTGESYWLRNEGPQYPRLEGERTVDVAVVGGGISGCAAALFLAETGASVALLERDSIAHGASGRNGGFVLAGTVEDFATAIDQFGLERATAIWRFSVHNLERAESLARRLLEEDIDCGYSRSGSIRLADSPEEAASIERSARELGRLGYQLELLSNEELPAAIRAHYSSGAFNPLDAEYDPAAFVRGLAQPAAAKGAQVYDSSAVLSLEEERGSVMIRTAKGSLRAERVVVCLNAYSSGLLPQLEGVLRPVRAQALVTAPIETRLFESPCYGHHGYHWWRQLDSGELIAGGWRNESFESEECADEVACEPVQAHIEGFVRRIAPGAAIEQRWAGLMGFTPDGLPLVGRLPGSERVWVAGGYNGHGNGLALGAVQAVVDGIAGKPNDGLSLFDPSRFGGLMD